MNTRILGLGLITAVILGTFLVSVSSANRPIPIEQSVITLSPSDFDAGDHDISQGTLWIEDTASGSPWGSWGPVAVYSPEMDRTYVVFEGNAPGNLPYITYYDHAAGLWATPVLVTDNNPLDPGDSHGAPSMWITDTGYILVACCAHITAGKIYRSSTPYNISTWDPLSDYAPLATYPSFYEYPSGTIWVFYRDSFADGGDWVYKTSDDSGTTWSLPTTMIDIDGGILDGAYLMNYAPTSAGNSLWWAWNKFEHASVTREDVYACRLNLDTGHVWSTDGLDDLGTSVDETENDASCRIVDFADPEQSTTGRLRVFNDEPYVI